MWWWWWWWKLLHCSSSCLYWEPQCPKRSFLDRLPRRGTRSSPERSKSKLESRWKWWWWWWWWLMMLVIMVMMMLMMVITHLPFDRCDRPNIAIDPHVVLVFNKTIGLTDLQKEITFYIYIPGWYYQPSNYKACDKSEYRPGPSVLVGMKLYVVMFIWWLIICCGVQCSYAW